MSDHDPVGPRRANLAERRKRERSRTALGGGALVVALVLIAAFIASRGTSEPPDEGDGAVVATAGEKKDEVINTLIIGATEEAPTEPVWITLLSVNNRTDSSAIIYIPAHTAVEVPGRGLLALGDALASGGMPLLLVTTENLLGVPIDRYLELSDRDARVLFGGTGPLSVDVPSDVSVAIGKNKARLLLTEGAQRLSAEFLVDLLYVMGEDGNDQELGARHSAFWTSLMEAFSKEPSKLGQAVKRAGAALSDSDVSIDDHAGFFEQLASYDNDDRSVSLLPVTQVTVGGNELYNSDADEVASFVTAMLGDARDFTDEIRVQILNGNGAPGIGQEVAQKLVGQGFRVVQSDNAQRLNYKKTLIVTYDASPAGQAIAEQARDLLGVGEVQVSRDGQGIVDLTIVVGEDFLRTT